MNENLIISFMTGFVSSVIITYIFISRKYSKPDYDCLDTLKANKDSKYKNEGSYYLTARYYIGEEQARLKYPEQYEIWRQEKEFDKNHFKIYLAQLKVNDIFYIKKGGVYSGLMESMYYEMSVSKQRITLIDSCGYWCKDEDSGVISLLKGDEAYKSFYVKYEDRINKD